MKRRPHGGPRGIAPRASLLTAILLAATLLAATGTASAANFHTGDLYLLSNGLPDVGSGIAHLDPVSGAVLETFDLTQSAIGEFAYDPFRDRLLYRTSAASGGLRTMDAAGVIDTLGPALTTPAAIAPRGDGIIYLQFRTSGRFGFLDASDGYHDLLDEPGMGPFSLGSARSPSEMIYEPVTNSLIAFDGSSSAIAQCPDPAKGCAFRIPLSADGQKVSGVVTSAQVDISTTGEVVVGASYAPEGKILWVVDTNSNNREPRMQLLDPVTVTTSTYASNGPYGGAAATDAGVYDTARGQALIVDTVRDSLRAFSLGEVGSGLVFGGTVSTSGGSGEAARLIEIWSSPLLTSVDRVGEHARPGVLVTSTPNPFSAVTELIVELASPASVGVSIHDATGRRVRALANGAWTAGTHVLSWDGRDTGGARCAPGIYFARVATGTSNVLNKLVLKR